MKCGVSSICLLKGHEHSFYVMRPVSRWLQSVHRHMNVQVLVCALLFQAYWSGGLHLFTPLPFSPGKGGFGDFFRTHIFINAGNLGNVYLGKEHMYLFLWLISAYLVFVYSCMCRQSIGICVIFLTTLSS
jgi:hypothetical protein